MKTFAFSVALFTMLFSMAAHADEVNDFCNAIKKNQAKAWLEKNKNKSGEIKDKDKVLRPSISAAWNKPDAASEKKKKPLQFLGNINPQLAEVIKAVLEKRRPASVGIANGGPDPLPPANGQELKPPMEVGQEIPGRNIEPGTGPDATGNSQLNPSEVAGASGSSESASKGID